MVEIDHIPYTMAPWKHDTSREVMQFDGADDVKLFEGDGRWPKACACGYEFTDDDEWQVFIDAIYLDAAGREYSLRKAPVGAMWDGAWRKMDRTHTPDELSLHIQTPGGEWFVDGGATNGDGWTRSGDPRANPPTVTANPSILAGSYHGWLRDGKLVDA